MAAGGKIQSQNLNGDSTITGRRQRRLTKLRVRWVCSSARCLRPVFPASSPRVVVHHVHVRGHRAGPFRDVPKKHKRGERVILKSKGSCEITAKQTAFVTSDHHVFARTPAAGRTFRFRADVVASRRPGRTRRAPVLYEKERKAGSDKRCTHLFGKMFLGRPAVHDVVMVIHGRATSAVGARRERLGGDFRTRDRKKRNESWWTGCGEEEKRRTRFQIKKKTPKILEQVKK